MRKFVQVFLLSFILVYLGFDLKAQLSCDCSDKLNTEKIFIKGKAPFAIDGKISDWETFILGPSTGNNLKPFELPETSAFNWTIDGDNEEEEDPEDCSRDFFDTPLPNQDQDIRLSAFTHDDYNVFFYFRRLARSNSPNSFYYFIDVNADGHMKEGEPVFHASFTQNTITTLTLSRYIPDRTTDFIIGKGNPLGRKSMESGETVFIVQDYPMSGTLEEVFNSGNIPSKHKLKKKEIFAAAITEDGFGVELAIPWQYLSLWFVHKKKDKPKHLMDRKWKTTKPLKPGDIFFYKLSMKQGGGQFRAADVVDNAGDFCDGVGKSGDVSVARKISPPVFIPGIGYRTQVSYTNRTNATEVFAIETISFSKNESNNEPLPNNEETTANVYVDKNCNGIIDPGDGKEEYTLQTGESNEDVLVFRFSPAGVAAPPFSKVCFIVEILLANDLIESPEIDIFPAIWFLPPSICNVQLCGVGRTIKRIGVASSSISTTALLTIQKGNEVLEDTSPSGVLVYPNPTNGTIKVYLPAKEGVVDLTLEDYLGKKVQQWNRFTSNSLQINNLNRGLYLLRVQYLKTGKVEVKKIVVH